MATMSVNATTERPGTLPGRLSVVPWWTVLPLAVVLAYADGFWVISMRGAAGSIERTQEPFVTWLRESTLVLPIFVLAVLGALALAARWFGPVLRKPKNVVATSLMVVVAGTLVGIALLAASSAYDYHLQSDRLQRSPMNHTSAPGSFVAQQDAHESVLALQEQASLDLQVRAVGLGSGILLVTNLVLVGWVVALRGGRLDVSKARQRVETGDE
jgi:glucan phosphoethanolaminetransferase (alkaline phosphatase superfamily)